MNVRATGTCKAKYTLNCDLSKYVPNLHHYYTFTFCPNVDFSTSADQTGFVGSAEFVKIQPTYNNKGATTILLRIGM